MVKSAKSDPSELQIALDNREFEIQLFWQRSNYFLVLMTALGIGVFTIKELKYALIISVFATITSWFWYKTNLGSKFWHESWEVEVVNLAKEQNVRSFERPMSDVIEQVRHSLEEAASSGQRGSVQRWLDRQILKKPSVSYYMILLSLTSTTLWGIVSSVQAYDLLQSHQVLRLLCCKEAAKKATLPPTAQSRKVTKQDPTLNDKKDKPANHTPQPGSTLASP